MTKPAEEKTPARQRPNGAALPSPDRTVVVSVVIAMTADGKIHVQPGPGTPRPPGLNDVYTLCALAQRDVQVKMISDSVTQQQVQLLGAFRSIVAQAAQQVPAETDDQNVEDQRGDETQAEG